MSWAPWILDIKPARNVYKDSSKIFQFNLASFFFHCNWLSCFTQRCCVFGRLFYIWKNFFLAFRLAKRKKGNKRKQKLLRLLKLSKTIKRLSPRLKYYCFSHSRISRIQKFFLSASHGGRQYFSLFSPVKNTFFTFCKLDSDTFKLLNCLDWISLKI